MSTIHEKLLSTLTTQAVDAADPPQDGVPRVLIFTDGKPLLVPLADVLPESVEGEELETIAAGAVEVMELHKIVGERPAYVLDIDARSQHFVNTSRECDVSFVTKAAHNEVVSAQIEVEGSGAITARALRRPVRRAPPE